MEALPDLWSAAKHDMPSENGSSYLGQLYALRTGAPSASTNGKSARNHIVAKTYLKNFCADRDTAQQIWVYDKREGHDGRRAPRLSSIKSVPRYNEFYWVQDVFVDKDGVPIHTERSDTLERVLARWENKIPNFLNGIDVASIPSLMDDAKWHYFLCEFLAVSFVRSPSFLDGWKLMLSDERVRGRLLKVPADDRGGFFLEGAESIVTLVTLIEYLASRLIHRQVSFRFTSTKFQFITCDNPVFYGGHPNDGRGDGSLPWMDGTFVGCALRPDVAVFLYPKEWRIDPPLVELADRHRVEPVQEAVAMWAHNYVFANIERKGISEKVWKHRNEAGRYLASHAGMRPTSHLL